MLTCQQITELVTEFLEGKLSFADRMRFQMHVGMCKHCRLYLGQMKQTIATVGALPSEPMPEDVQAELMRRFANWKK